MHTTRSSTPSRSSWHGPPVALFWDQSLVWGLLFIETFERLKIPYRLVSSELIRRGGLTRHRIFVAPGGWAGHKYEALGEKGRRAVSDFVAQGGAYLGVCGGAGLALSARRSLGLVPVSRKPFRERLPNASGEIWIHGDPDHPVWKDLPPGLPVFIWWPSQFSIPENVHVEVLATYGNPGSDFWVADLCTADVDRHHGDWAALEARYGIALNPERIRGEPAVLSWRSGRGRTVLSYPHLETPGSAWGNALLRNILRLLDETSPFPEDAENKPLPFAGRELPSRKSVHALEEAWREAESLIESGERNLLWRRRLPWLLQWQRGLRGLEYGTLEISLRCMVNLARSQADPRGPAPFWEAAAEELLENTRIFCRNARKLLLEEKAAGQTGPLGKLQSVNPSVDALRRKLFGSQMSHDGLCRDLFDRLDTLLFRLLEHRNLQGPRRGSLFRRLA